MKLVSQRTLMVALTALTLTSLVVPAFADDRHGHGHGRDRHVRHPPVHYAPPPRAYYAPPPVVYAQPEPVAPGLSLMFNFR